jgi:hypothetical protein
VLSLHRGRYKGPKSGCYGRQLIILQPRKPNTSLSIMLSLLASFSLLLPLAVSTPLALPEPVADIVSLQPGCELTFGSLFSAGTGCPQGSVRLDTYQNDRTRLIFYDMHAKVGDDVLESENYKTCDMSIDVTFPKGCFYTGKFDVERRGRTSLTSEAISARSEFGTTMSGTNQRVRCVICKSWKKVR